ncbi:MAG: DUF3071 domain-containing protein [Acidimicrobiia bacterium]|nr:DUF3071 domain-containing protein [Acidimicrobiia bacterium]
MQKLHLVGFTTDLDGLIFSARKGSKAGGYVVPLDGELLSTIAEAERLRNGDKSKAEEGAGQRVRPDSRLTPRETQAQLRSGRSIPEVAAEAGVGPEWVERFAVPIVAEQAQMVERARVMTFSKARLGQSTQPLGTSVRWNLADKGVAIGEEAFDQGWSAFQLQDEVWMVRFRYTSRARLQVAEWELDLGANELTSRNRLASELGYVEKGRRPPALPAPSPRPAAVPPVRVVEEVVVEEPEPEEAPAPAAPRRPVRKASRRARRRPAPKKRPARKTAATRSTKRSTTKRATAKKANAKKATTKKAVSRRGTSKKATSKKAVTRNVVTKTKAAPKRVATRPAAKKTPRPVPATRERTPAERPEAPRVEAVRRPRPRPAQARRPRIAADSAKEAAAKRAARPVRRTPPRSTSEGAPTATAPVLSGPLARSLLARRLAARKAADESNGGQRSSRPLRVR